MLNLAVNSELDIAYSSPEMFSAIALEWLNDGVQALAGDISVEILAGPPLVRQYATSIREEDPGFAVKTPPLWGQIDIVYPPRNKFYAKPYSRTSLKRLNSLAPELRVATVDLYRITGDNIARCHLEVHREGEDQGHARLLVQIARDSRGDYTAGSPEIAFMRQFAEHHSPDFGHISYVDTSSAGETELESCLRRRIWDSLKEWDWYLRGYSWVTVIPAILVPRVGGIGRLRDSGAFITVDELPGGAVWLQATSRWSEYHGERVEAVFETLALILPPGEPRRGSWDTREYLLSWRDAAEFHSAD